MNKKKIEHLIDVDLVYFDAVCNSFVISMISGLHYLYFFYNTHWQPIKTLLQPNVQHKIEQIQSKIQILTSLASFPSLFLHLTFAKFFTLLQTFAICFTFFFVLGLLQ
jgi:hypothetical protein